MTNLDLLGRVAYEAYLQMTGGRSLILGDKLPNWEDQRPDIREAWRAVADAVVMMANIRYERLQNVASEFVDNDACRYDHNDYCQTHYGQKPCHMARLRKLIENE